MSHTLIDWEQRMALKGKDLARWLQLYIRSHAKPYPVKVATLRDLSGSRAKALKNFRAKLRVALDDLVTIGELSRLGRFNCARSAICRPRPGYQRVQKSGHSGRKTTRT